MANTPRWALPYPAGTDPPNGPLELHDLAFALDDVAKDDQGTLAARPVSTGGSPGKKGRYYMVKGDATASNNNILWRDNGTGWDQVGGGGTVFDTTANRPAANAVPVGTRFFSTDQIAEWLSDGAAWHRLGDQPGDIVWTLEAAARTGYVLLDGAVWPSTVGIYADLFAKWGGANLPDIRGRQPVALGTHADVAALRDNEGVAVANRTPIHNTTIVDPGNGLKKGGAPDAYGGGTFALNPGALGITGGPGGVRPVDTGAFLVLQPQAKL
jgi:hypothetical protein